MELKTLEVLEFQKIKDLFLPFLLTEQGKQEMASLLPTSDQEKLKRDFLELSDIISIFLAYPNFSILKTQDIEGVIKRLDLGGNLNIYEILRIKTVLIAATKLKDFYESTENVSVGSLDRLFKKLLVFPPIQKRLQSINDAGFIEDFASKKLFEIRQTIRTTELLIRDILKDILSRKSDMLFETIILNRNGRSVLPVKTTYRNKIPGVIHDISDSGKTVYIEPRSVVQLNEKVSNYKAKETQEILKILSEVSNLIRPVSQGIKNNSWVIGHLDFVCAKYHFMQATGASIPILSKKRAIQLLQAKHPLMKNAIRNDICFSSNLIEIITGPSMGGKTTILKTLGVIQVMAQSGLPILASEGSQVGIFNQIFIDVGDGQSIERNLSTFSSHMTNIVKILSQVDQDSLILFDELGVGTDPKEGAALAISILDYLRLSSSKTMVTTHYPELKTYGIATEYVRNSSMEFSTDSLKPTYRLLLGVPGRSNAFDIARRLGLLDVIISDAEKRIDDNEDVSRIIEQLENQRFESRKRLENIQVVENETLKFYGALAKLYDKFKLVKENELNQARLEARKIVERALFESNEILKNLHAKSSLKPHEVIEAKNQLNRLTVGSVDVVSRSKVRKLSQRMCEAQIGDDIVLINYGQSGTLIDRLQDGRWKAQVGLMTVTLKDSDFHLVRLRQ